MTTMGQWLFQKEKETLERVMASSMARTGIVATSDASGVTVIDPLTGATGLEVLIPAGFRPEVGQRALILPLADGSRMALPFGQTPGLTHRGPLIIESASADGLRVRTLSGSTRFVVDMASESVKLWNSADLILYSDPGTTEVARIAGATGIITGARILAPAIRGITVDANYDATPTTASNSSLSTFTEHGTYSLALPAGTYDVTVVAFANYKNNTAGGGVRGTASVNGSVGTGVSELTAQANTLIPIAPIKESSGLSGTITLANQYRADQSGTATPRDVTFLTLAERTA